MQTPKIIWTFWDKGEDNLPNFLRICLESWRKQHPGWRVVILSPSNVLEYLDADTDLPATFFDIERKSLQSDVIRLAILARHGGIYTDISSLAMSNFAEEVRGTLDAGASIYAFHNFGWISDFVAAWFLACKPREPLMVEWSRAFNALFEGRTTDHGICTHPYFDGVDLSDYHSNAVGDNHPSQSWADYLIVNVALRGVLHHNTELSEHFRQTACLVDQGHGNVRSPTRLFDHADEVGVDLCADTYKKLGFPDRSMYVCSQLLNAQGHEAMRTAASAPFVKFFQAGKVCAALENTSFSELSSSSGIAQLIDISLESKPLPADPIPRLGRRQAALRAALTLVGRAVSFRRSANKAAITKGISKSGLKVRSPAKRLLEDAIV